MGRKVTTLGPHSRPHRFWNLDGRTREAKRVRAIRTELTAHCGGQPSVTQRLLIDRAAALVLRLELMDREDLTVPASSRDTREFFYVQNTLTRTLKALGTEAPPQRPRTPAEVMATLTRPGSRAA